MIAAKGRITRCWEKSKLSVIYKLVSSNWGGKQEQSAEAARGLVWFDQVQRQEWDVRTRGGAKKEEHEKQ